MMPGGIQHAPDRGLKHTVDWRIIVCFLLIVLFGWLNIYAAVRSAEPASIFDSRFNCGKQAIWIGAAFLVAILVLFVFNPNVWEAAAMPAYAVVCVLLVAVIFLGEATKGSHSWFSFGPVKFQPAELSKITTSLLLAAYMSRPNFKLGVPRYFWRTAAIILLPMLIIVAESETGSALVYVGFIFVLYREGLSGWYIAIIGMAILLFVLSLTTPLWVPLLLSLACAAAWYFSSRRVSRSLRMRRSALRQSLIGLAAGVALVFATDFLFHHVLKEHQRARIEVLLGLKEDPSGIGYNVKQSMIAIGSGGFFGKGYLSGTQTTYGFVPEQSTDFIFCTVGEEWGFLGSLFVIGLYGLLIWRIVEDAERARQGFTRIYGYCLASCLFMHLVINIGMTIGLVPVIGIPLPMFSYGGSSLLSFTLMIFIFVALNRQENKYF
ncbi:MAG: rod shape-determining protein RodA [Bacteroidales bacterium]|nr:rod shape-determining protein RodA [Bacteroidales bacterium]